MKKLTLFVYWCCKIALLIVPLQLFVAFREDGAENFTLDNIYFVAIYYCFLGQFLFGMSEAIDRALAICSDQPELKKPGKNGGYDFSGILNGNHGHGAGVDCKRLNPMHRDMKTLRGILPKILG